MTETQQGPITEPSDGEERAGPGDAVERPPPTQEEARQALIVAAIGLLVGVLSYVLLIIVPGHRPIVEALQFAATEDRFADRLAEVGYDRSLGDARIAIYLGLIVNVIWGAVGYVVFYGFRRPPAKDAGVEQMRGHWDAAWKARPGTEIPGFYLALAAVAAASLGIVEKLLSLASLTERGGELVLTGGPILPAAITVVAWVKWLIAGLALSACVLMVISTATATFRGRSAPPTTARTRTGTEAAGVDGDGGPVAYPTGKQRVHDRELTVGVCCSGGGIRSAGFCLGGLSALERVAGPDGRMAGLGILGRADYLASVSGGGYVATAWRILAGTDKTLPAEPVIGVPDNPERKIRPYDDDAEPALDLIQHVRERRRFLANGPGGLPISAAIAVSRTLWHILLILLTVFAVAWPLGRIVVSWPIIGGGRDRSVLDEGLDVSVGAHQVIPVLTVAAMAVLVWSLRLRQPRSKARNRIDRAATGLTVMAVLVALVVIVLPFAIDGFVALLRALGAGSAPQGLAVAGIYGTILTMVWQFAKRRLAKSAKYLGGVLLALGILGFALYVMANAADSDGPFSFWLLPVVIAAVLIPAMVFLNPDRWSLNSLYRSRLAGTFATRQVEWTNKKGKIEHRVESLEEQSDLDKYQGAGGPAPVICCAVARTTTTHTGIPALSMTFEPERVTVHRWPDRRADLPDAETLPFPRFRSRLPTSGDGRNLATPIGAAAVSGAAVAPSLGRMSLRST
ncbi:MAG: hypothetical protein ACR2QK_08745, partial [Acidimicrobiales bacterium]